MLYCMTVGSKPIRFMWFKNNKMVFEELTPKFEITPSMEGKYICKLIYEDGYEMESLSCRVECIENAATNVSLDVIHKKFNEWFVT